LYPTKNQFVILFLRKKNGFSWYLNYLLRFLEEKKYQNREISKNNFKYAQKKTISKEKRLRVAYQKISFFLVKERKNKCQKIELIL